MARQKAEGLSYIDGFIDQCREFGSHWVRFHQLIAAYPAATDKGPLEHEFLHLKSALARNHSVLKARLANDCLFSSDLPNVLAGATSLHSIHSQSDVSVKKLEQEWHRVFMSINETLGDLQEKRRRALDGERVYVGGRLVYIRPPFPWKRVMSGAAVVSVVLLLAGGAWFARNFLGYGAPEAGEGFEYRADMTEEEKVAMMVGRMSRAFDDRDIDTLMTAFSDEYADDEGNNKTKIRVMLQTLNSTIGFRDAKLKAEACRIKVEGDLGLISNMAIHAEGRAFDLVVHGRKDKEKWLITKLEVD
jgi:hypothetical protein